MKIGRNEDVTPIPSDCTRRNTEGEVVVCNLFVHYNKLRHNKK